MRVYVTLAMEVKQSPYPASRAVMDKKKLHATVIAYFAQMKSNGRYNWDGATMRILAMKTRRAKH